LSANVVRVTPQELRDVSTALKAVLAELEAELTDVGQELDSNDEAFEGKAAVAFQAIVATWKTAVGGSTLTLESLADFLAATANRFEAADAALGQAGGQA
jgi:WXG100 family type VII secretion target